jgi:hypothetical protein
MALVQRLFQGLKPLVPQLSNKHNMPMDALPLAVHACNAAVGGVSLASQCPCQQTPSLLLAWLANATGTSRSAASETHAGTGTAHSNSL